MKVKRQCGFKAVVLCFSAISFFTLPAQAQGYFNDPSNKPEPVSQGVDLSGDHQLYIDRQGGSAFVGYRPMRGYQTFSSLIGGIPYVPHVPRVGVAGFGLPSFGIPGVPSIPGLGTLSSLGRGRLPFVGSNSWSGSSYGLGNGSGFGGYGYLNGYGSSSGFGYGFANSPINRISNQPVFIPSGPSKAAGSYYNAPTPDATAAGNYYTSTSPAPAYTPPPRSYDYKPASGFNSGTNLLKPQKNYWGGSASPYPKDLNSTPWSNK